MDLIAGEEGDPTAPMARGISGPRGLFAYYAGLAAMYPGESTNSIIIKVLEQWRRKHEAGEIELEYEDVVVKRLK